MTLELAIYAGIGSLGGFFAGLLGIGGGVLFTPLLLVVYAGNGFDESVLVQMSIATTMAVISISSLGGAMTHARAKAVDWRIGMLLVPSVMLGAWAGAHLAQRLPGTFIVVMLIAFLLYQSQKFLLGARGGRPQPPEEGTGNSPPIALLLPAGVVIGVVSSIVGIGGGVILMPLLISLGVAVKRAIGTSSFNTFPLSLSAAIGYLFPLEMPAADLPVGTFGLVYLPALVIVGVFAFAAAVVGAKCTHVLPALTLRRILGVLFALISLRLIWYLLSG